MDRPLKKYPVVGACGLNCGLCPRHHSLGKSRCPGCCGPGFWEVAPSCGRLLTCCVKEHHLETCAQCPEWPSCEQVAKRLNTRMDSFISYKPLRANFAFIQEHGLEEFVRREEEKQELLRYLLDRCNDGRSKGFYCLASQLVPLDVLKIALVKVETRVVGDVGEKARLLREAIHAAAVSLGVDLRLRK